MFNIYQKDLKNIYQKVIKRKKTRVDHELNNTWIHSYGELLNSTHIL